jgi:hypothetical protein
MSHYLNFLNGVLTYLLRDIIYTLGITTLTPDHKITPLHFKFLSRINLAMSAIDSRSMKMS